MLVPPVNADTIKYATVFNIYTGIRKVVVVGDKNAFIGDYVLESKDQTLISYWQKKLDANNMDQKEIYKIPEIFWQTITPQIIKLISRDGQLGGIEEKIITCKGKECDKYFKAEAPLGFSVVSNYKTTLSRSITSTASTIYVSSLSTKDGHTLTMGDLGSKVFLTIEPGSNKEEIVMATGVGTLSWTGVTRGLAFYSTSTAAVTANQESHSAGSVIIMSNVHYVYDELVDKDTADTIGGDKTFTGNVIFNELPSLDAYEVPVADGDLAAKKYVDDTALATAPDATATVKGVTELATKAEAAAGASAGGTTGGLVLPASMATSTSQVATTSIVVSNTLGKIDTSFIDQTADYTWSGTNRFSGDSYIASSTLTATSTFQAPVIMNASTTINTIKNIGAGFTHMQVYTNTGTSTWSRPEGVTKIKVRLVGGGGNGGSGGTTATADNGGGGGGGYCEKIIDVSATSTIQYVVGNIGQITQFGGAGVFCYGNPGASVPNNTVAGGAGGTAVGGDLNIQGQSGGTSTTGTPAGAGGSSMLGFGGINADDGRGYGGGGSGCDDPGNPDTCIGGSGTQGIIIVEY